VSFGDIRVGRLVDEMMDTTARKPVLWRLAGDDEPHVQAVSALLGTIPDTVQQVVRFSNSSYVGALYPVSSMLDAVVRIGGRRSQQSPSPP
jgi:HD-like signal output (HDOD) protein